MVFGDSLSDVGNFNKHNPNISSFKGIGRSFTTSPDITWADNLPKSYSQQKDVQNYAVGGARVATEDPIKAPWYLRLLSLGAANPTIPSVKTQIDTHLKNNPKLDPTALYAVWIGSNDIMGIKGGNKDLQVADVKVVETAANAQVAQIERLITAGAKTMLVPSLTNIGITPEFNTSAEKQKITKAVNHYNTTLYKGLQGSQKTKQANIIVPNTFALLDEVIADPKGFGFKFGNGKNDRACKTAIGTEEKNWGCGKTEWQSPKANEEYIFADGIHPTGRTHRILAQYYSSLIDAPSQMGQLPQFLEQNQAHINDTLHRNINNANKKGKVGIWVDGSRSAIADEQDSRYANNINENVMVGVDFDWQNKKGTRNSQMGIYGGKSSQEQLLSNNLVAKVDTTSVGIYGYDEWGNFRLQSDFGYHQSDVATTRHIAWEGKPRSHIGNTTSQAFDANIQASYAIKSKNATVRPYLGVNASLQDIDAFVESNPQQSTALAYDFHPENGNSELFGAVQGKVGVDVDYKLSERVSMQAGIAHHQTLVENESREIETALPSLARQYGYTDSYTMPIVNVDDKATVGHLGVRFDFGRGAVNVGTNVSHINDETAIGGYVGLQASF